MGFSKVISSDRFFSFQRLSGNVFHGMFCFSDCLACWQVWHELYPAPRTHKKQRLDKGLSRTTSSQSLETELTETSWIRKRRNDVDDAIRNKPENATQTVDVAGSSCWGVTHEREVKFQSESRLKRKVQALRDGVLLPSEADQELEDYILNMKEPLPPDQLTGKEKKKNILYRGPQKASFLSVPDHCRHVTAFMCRGAGSAAQRARGLGMQMVDDPGLANVILAKNFTAVPEVVRLCAALRGSYIMDVAALSGGNPCLCCKFCQTEQLKRNVWVSAAFKQDSTHLFTM